MIEVGLVLFRAFHYTTSLVLFGVVLFLLYAYPRRVRPTAGIDCSLRAIAGWASFAALLSGVFWFAGVVVSMTDGVIGRDAIRSVLMETSFGKVSIARFILATVILVLAVKARSQALHLDWFSAVLCAGLVTSLAGVGHTQFNDGIDRITHTIADSMHLLAAGAWLGGLVGLFLLVAKSLRTVSPAVDAEARNAALRFFGHGFCGCGNVNWFGFDKLMVFGGIAYQADVNTVWPIPPR
jgi:putative copper resistance protein D